MMNALDLQVRCRGGMTAVEVYLAIKRYITAVGVSEYMRQVDLIRDESAKRRLALYVDRAWVCE